MASSRDLTCKIEKPAMSSLASVKGPSTTVRDLPVNLTRAPLELGWRPSQASRTPAFVSSSRYLPISSRPCGSGRAPSFSVSGVALAMTINSIGNLLYVERWLGGLLSGVTRWTDLVDTSFRSMDVSAAICWRSDLAAQLVSLLCAGSALRTGRGLSLPSQRSGGFRLRRRLRRGCA